jgi:hypothetical protein
MTGQFCPVTTSISRPFGITAGPDGALWFTDSYANAIGRITTSGEITEYPTPTADSTPYGITAGPDGALWFAENSANKIGRITTSGEITEYTALNAPEDITLGPDGALWFTMAWGNYIGRITTSGEVTDYQVPTPGSGPAGITVGGDGALWFTELNGNQIGTAFLVVTPRQRFARPIPMGVSVGNTPGGGTGTAGLLVHSAGAAASKFILSNNHVLGAVGLTACPSTAGKGRTWTLQPGSVDIGYDPGNNPYYYVGVVADYWPLSKTGNNVIDAAVSATSPAVAGSDILGIGQLNGVMRSAAIGEGVVKSGRTTGVTVGTVLDINCTTTVDYGNCGGKYTFTGQMAIFGVSAGAFSSQPEFKGNPFMRAGDSGSAVLDARTSTPVGLLFAFDPLVSYANPISSVYSSLGVLPDIPGGGGPSPEEELKAMDDLMQETLDPRLARLEEIQARHEDQLLSVEGVNGVCISLDESGEDFVLHVHVTKRTPELEQAIPQEIEGVPVRLVETGGPIKAY